MVLKCNVKGCRRSSSSDSEHSFFRLPKDVETRQKWLKFVGKENDYGHVRICTDHFDPQLIRKKYPRPLLVRNAVPTIRKSPEQNSRIKVCNHRFADDTYTPAQSPEKIQSNSSSPPRIKIINIHAKNLSQIIISDENQKVIINIKNDPTNVDGTHENV